MIRAGFLSTTERAELIELARNGLVEHRLARRANALVLLDRGMSCSAIGAVLFLDDDTVRTWFRLYGEEGIEGLAGFSYEGGAGHLSVAQQKRLKSWITQTLPRTTRHVGAWIEQEFAIVYQSRSGLIALLHRLGMEHRKPQAVSRKLDAAKQKAFIEAYDTLLNTLPGDEAVMFADAVHIRPMRCGPWAAGRPGTPRSRLTRRAAASA
jgi:transposase